MQRTSQHDQDEITWLTTAVRLGGQGLDLRQPSGPTALTRLENARFLDDRTLQPRRGHDGTLLADSGPFANVGTFTVEDNWVYGHGATLSPSNVAVWENAHHPIPGRAQTTFQFDGTDVAWTGDRLLVVKDDGPAIGASDFWNRSSSTTPLKRGIPAYLPVQTDSAPPAQVSGSYVETCLTPTLRVIVHTDTGGTLTAWIIDRTTNAVVDKSEISGASNSPVEPKVVNSADIPVAVWRDSSSKTLYLSSWGGTAWTAASPIDTDVNAFDIVSVTGGFFLLWRTAAPSTAELLIGKYVGTRTSSIPFSFGMSVPGITPDGPVALALAPSGDIGILASASGLKVRVFQPSMATYASCGWTTVDAGTNWGGGIAICSRGLKESSGQYTWVMHLSRGVGVLPTPNVTMSTALAVVSTGITISTGLTRQNSALASKSFRVGDEVFCWFRSVNIGTHYLIAGTHSLQVCGYADREEAIARASADSNYGIPHVLPDPLDTEGKLFSWARPYNTGQAYSHGGDVRLGDLDFLPDILPVQFGKSVYMPGCAVRNWDGVSLGDAGWQDFPVISGTGQSTGGSLTNTGANTGVYYYRTYIVRYNARGERFQSAATTFGPITLTGSNTKVTLTIQTVPDTNHNDAVIEVYRCETLGTTFYLEGTVANSLTAASVTFDSTISDAALRVLTGDSHAAGVGAASELEEWGPLGCSLLAVSGDRLWGAGGQVPPGVVQFSKLKEDGEGAGFDDLAGFQIVDTEGKTITSLHPLNDTTVIHQRNQLYVIAGIGPDNFGRGAFTIPQILLADGAITHFGTAITQLGALFWGQEGPRMLTTGFKVENISAPVRALAELLSPSGVRVTLSLSEAVWYTKDGRALLWNYLGDGSRWAEWTGLEIAGCSPSALVTTNGRLLRESDTAVGDGGQAFEFVWKTGNLRPEELLQGATLLRAVGVTGEWQGDHRLRIRVFYNGSPLWTDEWIWSPADDTWLTLGTDFSAMTAAQIDVLRPNDKSGGYATHKRVSRKGCHFFQVEVSNFAASGPTYVPFELAVELGAQGGLGRVPVNTFTSTIGR